MPLESPHPTGDTDAGSAFLSLTRRPLAPRPAMVATCEPAREIPTCASPSRHRGDRLDPHGGRSRLGPDTAGPIRASTVCDHKGGGTDNVYVFRYQGHQAMFVVTRRVIATDPIGLRRPQAVTTYIDEIKKVTTNRSGTSSTRTTTTITSPAASRSRTSGHASLRTRMRRPNSSGCSRPTWCCRTRWSTTSAASRSAARRSSSLCRAQPLRQQSGHALAERADHFSVDFIPLQQVFWRGMPDSWLDEWELSLKPCSPWTGTG